MANPVVNESTPCNNLALYTLLHEDACVYYQ